MLELYDEETRRQARGESRDQQYTSVLAAPVPSPAPSSPASLSLSPVTPIVAAASLTLTSGLQCGYCDKLCHKASVCLMKQRDRARCGGCAS